MFQKLRAYVLTLRFRILVIVLFCWLLPVLALGGYMGTVFFSALKDKTEAALSSSAEHAQTLAIQNIQRAVTLAKDVTYDGELATTAADYLQGKLTYHDFYRISRNYLERKYGREPLFTFASYFPVSHPLEFMYTTVGYQSAIAFQQSYQTLAIGLAQELDTRCAFAGWGEGLYLVRNLYNLRMERYGILVLGVNIQELLSPLLGPHQMWEDGLDLMLDDFVLARGKAVDWAHEPLGLTEQQDHLSYAQVHAQRDYTLKTRVQVAKKAVYAQMEQFQNLLWLLVLAIVPVGVMIMWFVHRRIAKPIFLLSKASRRMADGELGVTVPMRGKDELGQLGITFSSMSAQIRHLIDTAYKEEIALRDARIAAMQSRINPHFLNNALEMITWQARMDKDETIAAMVEALSVLLNASLDRGNSRLVPLREELNIADAYFYFVRLRFGERLTVWKDVDPALLECSLPRMAIQTLLENAIEHGIAPMGGGHIRLKVYADALHLHVEVLNDGRKLSEEDRAKIAALLKDGSEAGGHLGIRNVSQRLRLIYGDKAGLRIGADKDGDTLAAILIPLHAIAQAQTTNDIPSQ